MQSHRATKSLGEREDEEVERLVRPLPKDKPPRHDRRRERIRPERDPHIDDDPDIAKDPDMSLNYKKVGLTQHSADDKVRVRRRDTGKVVEVSRDTLKERGGDYEKVDRNQGKAPSDSSGDSEPKKSVPPGVPPETYGQPEVPSEGAQKPPKKKPKTEQSEGTEQPEASNPKSKKLKPGAGDQPTEESKSPPESSIPPPKRRKPTPKEQTRALMLLTSTFPTSVAAQYVGLHPDDIHQLVKTYEEAQVLASDQKNLSEVLKNAAGKFQTDINKVKAPKAVVVGDKEVPFDSLSPERQSEEMQRHRIATVAYSLAARPVVVKMLRSNGAPQEMAATVANFLLKNNSVGKDREAAAAKVGKGVFVKMTGADTIPISTDSREKIIKSLEDIDPATRILAVAHFQAMDYQMAKKKFLASEGSVTKLTEHESAEEIVRKLKSADAFFKAQSEQYPDGAKAVLDDPGLIFRERIVDHLNLLNPKKGREVRNEFDRIDSENYEKEYSKYEEDLDKYLENSTHEHGLRGQLPIAPVAPIPPPRYYKMKAKEGPKSDKPSRGWLSWLRRFGKGSPEEKVASRYVVACRASELMHRYSSFSSYGNRISLVEASVCHCGDSACAGDCPCQQSKQAMYHGIEPYPKGKEGFEPYAEWGQAHQCEIGDSDYDALLKAAKSWLKEPVLSMPLEGTPKDVQYRAALDLAIRDYANGRYAAGFHPAVYDYLLAKLSGAQVPKPVVASGKYKTMSLVLIASDAKARFNIDVIKAASQVRLASGSDLMPLMVIDTKSAPAITASQERAGMVREHVMIVQYPQGYEKQAFEAIRAKALRFGFVLNSVASSYMPRIRKASVNAGTDQRESQDMGMPKFANGSEADNILGRLDKIASFVQDNYARWGMDIRVAKSIVNDLDKIADEIEVATYGTTSFEARQAEVVQRDSDEKYMDAFKSPMAPIETDADEKYMSAYKDDQSAAVQNGKSTSGRPLAP